MKYLIPIACVMMANTAFASFTDEESVIIERHKNLILEKFPGSEFTEVEKDKYKGNPIYEYEFLFKGKEYEAFITHDDRILRLGLDD